MYVDVLIPFFLAFGLYLNTLPAEFAYDDSRAILKNPDILPEVPLTNLFYDDFWGTPLTHSGSHKSYRPLCVLSFRLNYLINGLSPLGYHLGNALLHAVATATFVVMVRTVFRNAGGDSGGPVGRLPLTAGLLFASHPIHTEAVAGVVGRADLLSCLFFLLALIMYVRYCDARCRRHVTQAEVSNGCSGDRRNGFRFRFPAAKSQLPSERLVPMTGCVVFTAAAMLSKEQGITVVAVCAAYDFFVHEGLRPNDILRLHKARYRGPREGLLILFSTTAVFLGVRLHLMGAKPPNFSPSDNPASDSESLLTRTLTFLYLPFVNLYLLVFPLSLNFDWSMGAIRLVESPTDPRNLSSSALYAALAYALLRLLQSLNSVIKPATGDERQVLHADEDALGNQESEKTTNRLFPDHIDASRTIYRNGANGNVQRAFANGHHKRRHARMLPEVGSYRVVTLQQRNLRVLLIGLCLLVFPFLPATNLFFYVGFVVAERVLYIPSTGYCILVAQGAELLYTRCRSRCWARLAVCLAAIWLIGVFSLRTFMRNLDWRTEEALYRSGIAVNPAKAWGNLANVLYSKGRFTEAEEAYKSALDHRSNMADVHYNLGILYQGQGRFNEAVRSYRMAIQFRPKLTMAHLNLGIVYSTIGRKVEAEAIYRRCAELDTTGLKDPRLHDQTKVSALYNLGRLLADEDRHQEAVDVYLEAIDRRPIHYQPQSLYNMLGESYAKLDQLNRAEFYYRLALKSKSDHIPAHLTMAKLYHRQGRTELAEEWFKKAIHLDAEDPSVYQHYGQFLGEVGRPLESVETFLKAVRLSPTDFDVVFGTANSLRQAGRQTDAEKYYREAVQLKPNMAIAHMNLGAILHYNGKLKEAERSYEMALRLKPNDVITSANLNKLRNLIEKQNIL